MFVKTPWPPADHPGMSAASYVLFVCRHCDQVALGGPEEVVHTKARCLRNPEAVDEVLVIPTLTIPAEQPAS
jgi:hypothetical protein